jgi:hypothetical protein
MRCLNINKSIVFYALYIEDEEIIDKSGYPTGEFKPKYGEIKSINLNVSSAKGNEYTAPFGSNLEYDRTLVTEDVDLPIDEKTIFWIDEKNTNKPYDYIVKKVAKSINSISYAVKKVDVR